jgi:hypothetical protein
MIIYIYMAIVGYGWVRYVSFLYTHMYAYIYIDIATPKQIERKFLFK